MGVTLSTREAVENFKLTVADMKNALRSIDEQCKAEQAAATAKRRVEAQWFTYHAKRRRGYP